jgi:hypothetical protein
VVVYVARVVVALGAFLLLRDPASAQDGCPDTGSAGNTIPIPRVFKADNTCEVTDGKFVKKNGSYRIDLEVTATGYCDVYTTPPQCPFYER